MEPDTQYNECRKRSNKMRLHVLETGHLSDCQFLVGNNDDVEDEDLSNDRGITSDIVDMHMEESDTSNINVKSKLFRCHKMVLATASEVYERMFYGIFAEQPSPIIVNDIRPEVFEIFIKFIYTNEIDPYCVTMANIDGLVYVADKYMIRDFSDSCINILKSKTWQLSDILPMFELASLYGNISLLVFCYQKICMHGENLLKHQTFYDLNVNYMKRLMVVLTQQKKIQPNNLLTALEMYGKKNGLRDLRNSEKFVKLVESACILDFSKMSSKEYSAGPASSYLF